MAAKNKQALYSTIQAARKGLTMAELLAPHPDIARRTAQRWVTAWVKDGRITAVGKARARRYVPTARSGISPAAYEARMSGEAAFGADDSGVFLPAARPLRAWNPAGYEPRLLDIYRPDETFYLDSALRRRLRAMGDTGQTKTAAGTHARAIVERLSIDLSWASSRLEGNSYSLRETRELIERGNAAGEKGAVETQMILNHKAAIELLVDNAGAAGFDRYTLLNLHGTLSENLLRDPAQEGRLRRDAVETEGGSDRPQGGIKSLEELLDAVLEKAAGITDPFEQSFFAMLHLTWLRPFPEVNRPTSRLMANLPLIRANLCPLTFAGVPEADYSRAILGLYETSRLEPLRNLYLLAYERSVRSYLGATTLLAEPDPVRLEYRDAIRRAVQDVVKYREDDPPHRIRRSLDAHFADLGIAVPAGLEAKAVAELGRLHDGVLARYGLRPAQYALWRERWKH